MQRRGKSEIKMHSKFFKKAKRNRKRNIEQAGQIAQECKFKCRYISNYVKYSSSVTKVVRLNRKPKSNSVPLKYDITID